jgi:hypothetical protein
MEPRRVQGRLGRTAGGLRESIERPVELSVLGTPALLLTPLELAKSTLEDVMLLGKRTDLPPAAVLPPAARDRSIIISMPINYLPSHNPCSSAVPRSLVSEPG